WPRQGGSRPGAASPRQSAVDRDRPPPAAPWAVHSFVLPTRQREPEGAAEPGARRLGPDAPVLRLHDALADRQPEPGATRGARDARFDAMKTLEHPPKLVGRDADALVAHAHGDVAVTH